MPQGWTENLGTARTGDPFRGAAAESTGDEIQRARKWLLAVGILSLLAGAGAILVPAVASVTIAIFTGWVLIAVGAMWLAHEIRMRGRAHRSWADIVTAILTLLAGICLVVFPLTGTLTLTFFLIAWFFTSAAVQLVAWWQMRGEPGAGVLAFHGVINLILGILIAADLPSSAAWAIGLLVGVNLVFFGVRALMAANLLKELAPGRRRPA
jgi:uncharacterized membrane protein HdeD (DUF308 family)